MRKARSSLPLAVQLLAPAQAHAHTHTHAHSPSPSASLPSLPSLPLASPTPSPAAPSPAHPSPSPSPTATSCLPPLFATPTSELAALHERLYHFVALLLRAYVQQWYRRLSPRDATALPAINAALVPIVRPLLDVHREDVAELLLVRAPALLLLHLRTLREARTALLVSGACVGACVGAGEDEGEELAARLGDAYHARLPLRSVARAPDGRWAVDPEYYVALGLALQPPGPGADVQRTLVAELLAGSVLGNVSKRITMPWFWAQVGHKLLSRRAPAGKAPAPAPLVPLVQRARAAGERVSALYALWAASPPPERKYACVAAAWVAVLRELARADERGLAVRVLIGALGVLVLLLAPVLDRLAPVLLARALTPQLGTTLVAALERAVFPCDGWPSPDEFRVPPPHEQARLWAQLRADVRGAAPWAARVLGDGWEDGALDALAHPGPNAHLAAMLYDAAVGALAPGLLQ